MRLLLALFISLIALPATVSAQTVPVLIPVQGILTDAQEAPVTGTVAMTFTIYDVADASIFSQTLSVDVENGFYSVSIGDVTGGLPQAAFQNGDATQLGIKVGSDAEMSPRLVFGSVPYALAAEFAAEADSAQNAVNAQNAATVDDGAITTAKLADSAVTQAKLAGATQVYKVTTGFCEQEPGTLMTSPACHARQYNVDACPVCSGIQQKARNCTGACICAQPTFCIINMPCPPSRGPTCPNQPAGYVVGP